MDPNIHIEEESLDNLYVGKLFVSWEEVTVFLDNFCMQKGFGYRKGRSTKMDNTEDATKRTFLYKHAGTSNANSKTTTLNE